LENVRIGLVFGGSTENAGSEIVVVVIVIADVDRWVDRFCDNDGFIVSRDRQLGSWLFSPDGSGHAIHLLYEASGLMLSGSVG